MVVSRLVTWWIVFFCAVFIAAGEPHFNPAGRLGG